MVQMWISFIFLIMYLGNYIKTPILFYRDRPDIYEFY